MTTRLRPFFSYFGSKWRLAPRYPSPVCNTVVEPFAGSASYALLHHDRQVILIDRYPAICALWRYLIGVTENEVRALPLLSPGEAIPSSLPEESRMLIGFWSSKGTVRPGQTMHGNPNAVKLGCWGPSIRERIASQLRHIRHWTVIDGGYTDAPDIEATWFIDPPYQCDAGRRYVHSDIDFADLGGWCSKRRGLAIACEMEGADWLPFQPFAATRGTRRNSQEVLWTNNTTIQGG